MRLILAFLLTLAACSTATPRVGDAGSDAVVPTDAAPDTVPADRYSDRAPDLALPDAGADLAPTDSRADAPTDTQLPDAGQADGIANLDGVLLLTDASSCDCGSCCCCEATACGAVPACAQCWYCWVTGSCPLTGCDSLPTWTTWRACYNTHCI